MVAGALALVGGGDSEFLPMVEGLQVNSTPTDGGTSNRQTLEAFFAHYGPGIMPNGDITVDQTVRMFQNGVGLAGIYAPDISAPYSATNIWVPRLVPGPAYALNSAKAFGSQQTDTVCNLQAGSNVLIDPGLLGGGFSNPSVFRFVIDANVPAGTYLRSVTTATASFSAVASGGGGPTTITATVPGLLNGQGVRLTGGTGNWLAINGTFAVSNVTGTTFTIAVDSSTFGAFTATSPTVHTATGVMSAVATNTVSNETVILGPSIYYSLIQSGDDNSSYGNWLFHIATGAGTTCPTGMFNCTSRGLYERYVANGGFQWCWDSSGVGGNAPQAGGGGIGADARFINCDTDNTENFTAASPGGCFRVQSGKIRMIGGRHTNGYKYLHSSELEVIGGYWKMDDNTNLGANAVPHVDVYENCSWSGLVIEGVQGIAMIRRNVRGGGDSPVTITDDSSCKYIPAGSGTPNLPFITDLQPPNTGGVGHEFDPISLHGQILSFAMSSNSGGTSPFSALADDPRAINALGMVVDGGAVAQFSVNNSFTETTTLTNGLTSGTTLAVTGTVPALSNGQLIVVNDGGGNTQEFAVNGAYGGGAGNVTITAATVTLNTGSGYTVTTTNLTGSNASAATAVDPYTNWAASNVGALVSVGTTNQKTFIVTSITTTVNTNDTLNGSGGWLVGSRGGARTGHPTDGSQFNVQQVPAPTVSTLFPNSNSYVPLSMDRVVYQITFSSPPVNVVLGPTPAIFDQTVAGSYTYTLTSTAIQVDLTGGGGGGGGGGPAATPSASAAGGSGGGGGGSGQTVRTILTGLTPGNTLAVTVGAGGIEGVGTPSGGGAGVTVGGVGGVSSIASGTQTITTVTAYGGTGGNFSNTQATAGAGMYGTSSLVNRSTATYSGPGGGGLGGASATGGTNAGAGVGYTGGAGGGGAGGNAATGVGTGGNGGGAGLSGGATLAGAGGATGGGGSASAAAGGTGQNGTDGTAPGAGGGGGGGAGGSGTTGSPGISASGHGGAGGPGRVTITPIL